jgi:hypothetical protein
VPSQEEGSIPAMGGSSAGVSTETPSVPTGSGVQSEDEESESGGGSAGSMGQ